jgi:hypothetical protein
VVFAVISVLLKKLAVACHFHKKKKMTDQLTKEVVTVGTMTSHHT